MNLIECIVRFSLLTCLFGSSASVDMVDYIVKIVENLSKIESGVPSCVFYGGNGFEQVVERVIRATELKFVVKTVITKPIDFWQEDQKPMLLIIQGDEITAATVQVLRQFAPSTKVIVLSASNESVADFQYGLVYLSYYNTVYLIEETQTVVTASIGVKYEFDNFPEPRDMFKNFSKPNMFGEPILYSSRGNAQNKQVLLQWIENAASLMNTSAFESTHSCNMDEFEIPDICYFKHFKQNEVSIDLSEYFVSGSIVGRLFGCLHTILTKDISIMIPRSSFNILEIFGLPLNWELWLLLSLIFIGVEIAHLAQPRIFRNEPILTVVCGYEKYDLHKSNQWEKVVLISMIILMFFITQVYEIKLVSMMISRPVTEEMRSLEKLLSSGIKIKVDFLRYAGIVNNSPLEHFFVNASEDVLSLDMEHAYILERNLAKLITPMFYDPNKRIQRYYIMEQSLGVFPIVFLLQKRGPFEEIFGKSLAAFVESGIYGFLLKSLKTNFRNNYNAIAKQFPSVRISLNFSDFSPAWLAWLFGFAASLLTFGAEMMVYKILLIASKFHERQNKGHLESFKYIYSAIYNCWNKKLNVAKQKLKK